jgi:hypothetical protein
MRILVICRPAPGVDPKAQIMPLAGAELAALRDQRERGPLREAYSPGGPGAILIYEGSREEVEAALAALPMAQAGVIEATLTELHPFAGLSE